VRGRVHPRRRPLHLRGAGGARRTQRSGARRHRRDHPRCRSEGRQVWPRGDRRHPHGHRGHRRGAPRRRAASGARGRGARRSLRILQGPTAMSTIVANKLPQDVPANGVSFGDAMRVWARVAALSFGGPAGQIAVMHRIIVEEKKWIGENRFLQALNYCTLLPGPEAQQLATYIGWLMHKTKGGLFAGTLFVLPGLLAIMALSWIYVLLGKLTLVEGLFFGLKAAVLVIVIQAVLRVGKRALNHTVMVALATGSFVAIFFYDVPFPVIVFGAGLIGFVGGRLGWQPFLSAGGHGKVGATQVADRDSLLGEETPAHA